MASFLHIEAAYRDLVSRWRLARFDDSWSGAVVGETDPAGPAPPDANGVTSEAPVRQRLDKPGLDTWRQRWRIAGRDATGRVRVFYLKRYDRPPWRQQLRRILVYGFGSSTAGVELRMIQRMSAHGVGTPRAVASGHELAGGIERRSFVLTEAVPGESLERWVPAQPARAESRGDVRRRRRILLDLARFVAAFHRTGCVHRDLYLSHVFIEPSQDGGARFRLIDLARVFSPRWRRFRWIVKDLSALDYSSPATHVTRADRLRFLRAYLAAGAPAGDERTLARRVARRTRRLMSRRRKRAGAIASAGVSAPAEGAGFAGTASPRKKPAPHALAGAP